MAIDGISKWFVSWIWNDLFQTPTVPKNAFHIVIGVHTLTSDTHWIVKSWQMVIHQNCNSPITQKPFESRHSVGRWNDLIKVSNANGSRGIPTVWKVLQIFKNGWLQKQSAGSFRHVVRPSILLELFLNVELGIIKNCNYKFLETIQCQLQLEDDLWICLHVIQFSQHCIFCDWITKVQWYMISTTWKMTGSVDQRKPYKIVWIA